MRLRPTPALVVVALLFQATTIDLVHPATLLGQTVPDSTAIGTTTASPEVTGAQAASPLPAPGFFFSAGGGYGMRFDPCAQCTSVENIESFTAHVSLGTYLIGGLGVGVNASAWRRGHPGVPTVAPPVEGEEGSGGLQPTSLVNQLTNVSLTFSYQAWHTFAHAGVGVALARQDVQAEDDTVSRASGKGIGYTIGGGIMLPIAGPASLMLFGNWNHGRYDLVSPEAILQRGVTHDYAELGFGVTIR